MSASYFMPEILGIGLEKPDSKDLTGGLCFVLQKIFDPTFSCYGYWPKIKCLLSKGQLYLHVLSCGCWASCWRRGTDDCSYLSVSNVSHCRAYTQCQFSGGMVITAHIGLCIIRPPDKASILFYFYFEKKKYFHVN